MSLWREDPVPQQWRGLWQRLALERADGSGDTTTRVVWLQTEHAFVDLRIPADRPPATGFVPTPAAPEGFAGRLLHDGARARWERRIDLRPPANPDEGTLVRHRRVMVERGLHEDYVEHWWLVASGDTEVIADTPTLIAVRLGDHLMFARERRPDPAADRSDRAPAGARALAARLDCEVAYACRARFGWRILASTLPWREGRLLAARELLPRGES